MTRHREALKEQLSKIYLRDKSVIDWGAGSKPASRYIHYDNCTFFTIDKNNYNKPDMVVDIAKDIHLDQMFDAAFCLEVIEHVIDYTALIRNIDNHLRVGGVLYMSAPFQFEIHAEEDYWRFTKHGLRLLLEYSFTSVEIISIDGDSGYFIKAVK